MIKELINNKKEKIKEIYQRRQKAHDELLACDIEIDNILKEILEKAFKYDNL
jgi:hypothetical protein